MFDWDINARSYITSRSKTDLQSLSSVKVSDKNCYVLYYHHRFIIQSDKIEQQSNTS